jgi:hypothetical protein
MQDARDVGARVVGLVIGSRKCGTTWLYENFLADPDICVSRKVKESGYFARAGEGDSAYYESLFPESTGQRVEVDSSLVYSDESPARIMAYNPQMKLVLVIRDPVEYAVSRYLHMQRKDQLPPARIPDLIASDGVLRSELDYATMLARFARFRAQGSLLVVPYSLLASDPASFYRVIKGHLVGRSGSGFQPKADRVNVSRSSSWAQVRGMLSRAANAARRRRLHGVVNLAKRIGLHRLLEKPVDARQLAALRESVSRAVITSHGASVELYRQIERQYAAGRN